MFDVTLWLCGHGETKDNTVLCLIESIRRLPYKIGVEYLSGDALIGRSRSVAATRFLKANEAPYLIFIDTDITFSPGELEKLIKALQEGYDVIAGAYSVASGERLAVRGWDASLSIDGQIREVEYVSTGFMGISRRSLEKIRDELKLPLLHKGEWCECWPFFESGRYEKELFYISEDWDFCNKARQAGYKVYLHTGCLVDHMKTIPLVCEEVLARARVSNPVLERPDVDIISDLSEFLNRPFAEVRNDVINCQAFQKKGRTDDEWLYDLAQLNSYVAYFDQRLYPISQLHDHHILDYGCGIGTAAIFVSSKNKVVGFDISKKSIEFANYRVKKRGFQNVEFTDKEPEDLSQFDIILLIDILEHFEDLHTFMLDLGKRVKRGTRLYHFNSFTQHIPEHYDHSKEWPSILENAGFLSIDQLWSIKS